MLGGYGVPFRGLNSYGTNRGLRGDQGAPRSGSTAHAWIWTPHSCASYTDGLAPFDSKEHAPAPSDGAMPLCARLGGCWWQKPRPVVSGHPLPGLGPWASHKHMLRVRTGPPFVHLPFPRTVVFREGCVCEGTVNFFHFILIKDKRPCHLALTGTCGWNRPKSVEFADAILAQSIKRECGRMRRARRRPCGSFSALGL